MLKPNYHIQDIEWSSQWFIFESFYSNKTDLWNLDMSKQLKLWGKNLLCIYELPTGKTNILIDNIRLY